MKLMRLLLALMLAGFSARAASIEGDVTLPYIKPKSRGASFTVDFGTTVKAACAWRVGEYYGWETLLASATVKNAGDKSLWVQCCVAFYDKDRKLVATAAQALTDRDGLKPGKPRRLPLCRIILPRDKYKDIVFYQATLYETDTPPLPKKGSILLEDP